MLLDVLLDFMCVWILKSSSSLYRFSPLPRPEFACDLPRPPRPPGGVRIPLEGVVGLVVVLKVVRGFTGGVTSCCS